MDDDIAGCAVGVCILILMGIAGTCIYRSCTADERAAKAAMVEAQELANKKAAYYRATHTDEPPTSTNTLDPKQLKPYTRYDIKHPPLFKAHDVVQHVLGQTGIVQSWGLDSNHVYSYTVTVMGSDGQLVRATGWEEPDLTKIGESQE